MRLPDPPVVTLLATMLGAAPLAARRKTASPGLRFARLASTAPTVLVTARIPPVILIVLLPPPATMVLAKTLPPLMLRVPLSKLVDPDERAMRRVVLAFNVAPEANKPLLFTLMVPLIAPAALVALEYPSSTVFASKVPEPSVR